MRLDVREPRWDDEILSFYGGVEVFDKDTGRTIPYVLAVDDSTGQVVRYDLPFPAGKLLDPKTSLDSILISEIRNVEVVMVKPFDRRVGARQMPE